MTQKQKFNLHAHYGLPGREGYQIGNRTGAHGRNTPDDMLTAAKSAGFETYGLVSHFDFNRNFKFEEMQVNEGMQRFNKIEDAVKDYTDSASAVRSAAEKVPDINAPVGFEVDFYRGNNWRKDFEKITKNLDFDYLIGASHAVSNNTGTIIGTTYWPINDHLMKEYFETLKSAIQSGLFDFIAHPYAIHYSKVEYLPVFRRGMDEIANLLAKHNVGTEINTSKSPYPEYLKTLAQHGVKTMISDDAHDTKQVGTLFKFAEHELKKNNVQNRLTADEIQKIIANKKELQ